MHHLCIKIVSNAECTTGGVYGCEPPAQRQRPACCFLQILLMHQQRRYVGLFCFRNVYSLCDTGYRHTACRFLRMRGSGKFALHPLHVLALCLLSGHMSSLCACSQPLTNVPWMHAFVRRSSWHADCTLNPMVR